MQNRVPIVHTGEMDSSITSRTGNIRIGTSLQQVSCAMGTMVYICTHKGSSPLRSMAFDITSHFNECLEYLYGAVAAIFSTIGVQTSTAEALVSS